MMVVTLQEAIDAARNRCSSDEWLMMSPGEQTRVIYGEMRRLDHEQSTAKAARRDRVDEAAVTMAVADAGPEITRISRSGAQPAVQCRAPVRTRSTGLCAWKAAVLMNGVPYCGFHARLEEVQRRRACASVAAD
jgi:hypothetical protein